MGFKGLGCNYGFGVCGLRGVFNFSFSEGWGHRVQGTTYKDVGFRGLGKGVIRVEFGGALNLRWKVRQRPRT